MPHKSRPQSGPSFASVVKETSTILSVASSPLENKGGYFSIKINAEAYAERLRLCYNALIGRVVLLKGELPWKVANL